jgi:hypothetical protein
MESPPARGKPRNRCRSLTMNSPASSRPRPPPPRGSANGASPQPAPTGTPAEWKVASGRRTGARRIVLYGPGKVGKSTLASLVPGRVAFLDIEEGAGGLDVSYVEGIAGFQDLRAILQGDLLKDFDTIVIDTMTKAQELALAYTLANVPHEKGHRVTSIEGYGFGKGYQFVYDTFMLLLGDLDRCVRRGQNVVLICHECVSNVPNPAGEDFIRYEPHLQSPPSGKASIRNRVVQWADDVLFVCWDVIAKDGKGKGGGTRSIWTVERPDHIAGSRRLADGSALPESLPYEHEEDGRIWDLMFINNNQPQES